MTQINNSYDDDIYDNRFNDNYDDRFDDYIEIHYNKLENQSINCCTRIKNIWKSCIHRFCLYCKCKELPNDISIGILEDERDLL